MKRLLAWMRLVRLVWTEDHDGEIRLRIARRHGPQWRCNAISMDDSVILNPDGTTSGKCYISKWYPYDRRSPKPSRHETSTVDSTEEWPEYITGNWG